MHTHTSSALDNLLTMCAEQMPYNDMSNNFVVAQAIFLLYHKHIDRHKVTDVMYPCLGYCWCGNNKLVVMT